MNPLLRTLLAISLLLPLLNSCIARHTSNVSIVCDQPAKIMIDGKEVGTSPLQVFLAQGNHQVVTALDGYETQFRSVRIDTVSTSTLQVVSINMPIVLPEDIALPDNTLDAFPSPDNRWIIVTTTDYDTRVYHVEQKKWMGLTLSDNLIGQAYWSPDSQMVALSFRNGPIWLYRTGQWDSHNEVFQAPLHPGNNYAFPHDTLVWSPDSQKFAITQIGGDTYAYVCQMDDGCQTLLSNVEVKPWIGDAIGSRRISWSPDGKRIAYVTLSDYADRVNRQAQLWTIDVETQERQKLWQEGEWLTDPLWSPDGERIALEPGFMYDFSTGKMQNLAKNAENEGIFPLQWSPDSQYLLAVYSGTVVLVISANTGNRQYVYNGPEIFYRWTGDRTWLIVRKGNTFAYIPVILP